MRKYRGIRPELASEAGKRPSTLAEIYNWFIEGFDIMDLKDAKAPVEELAEQRTSRTKKSRPAGRVTGRDCSGGWRYSKC